VWQIFSAAQQTSQIRQLMARDIGMPIEASLFPRRRQITDAAHNVCRLNA
jgi:hypothetical protein